MSARLNNAGRPNYTRPTAGQGQFVHVFLGDHLWTDDLENSASTLIRDVCLTYWTVGKAHHSAACFYYRAGMMRKEHLSSCGTGNYTDWHRHMPPHQAALTLNRRYAAFRQRQRYSDIALS
jgi:hypothetical protein